MPSSQGADDAIDPLLEDPVINAFVLKNDLTHDQTAGPRHQQPSSSSRRGRTLRGPPRPLRMQLATARDDPRPRHLRQGDRGLPTGSAGSNNVRFRARADRTRPTCRARCSRRTSPTST
ncbi:MAG: hypothetical protein MZU97_09475 [Bacillus subtilis]|nr:hypothetical protein [Bacillus subtilis]